MSTPVTRISTFLAHLVLGRHVTRHRFEDLRADVAVLRELRLDVVARLGTVFAGVGTASQTAGVHHGGGPGRAPGVVLQEEGVVNSRKIADAYSRSSYDQIK